MATAVAGVRPVRTMRDSDSNDTGITGPSGLHRLFAVICCLGMLVGAGLLAWVWASPQYYAWVASNQFSEAISAGPDLGSPAHVAAMEQAEAYNQQISGTLTLPITGGIKDYENQLDADGSGIMSWLEIPSIDVNLPVYHGDSDETLERGLGHLDYTSLPVGGNPSHCVITGHSGMPGNYMFDDLESLKPGDLFVLWTLSEPFAYRVYGADVVDPDDGSTLEIVPGRDLATLVTCTPYRINTHRLLVHAERVPYDPDEVAAERAKRPLHLERLLALGGAIGVILALPLLWALLNNGIIAWGTRGASLLTFSLWRRVKLNVGDHVARGRRRRTRQGAVIVEFGDQGDLVACMAELGRPEMAVGTEFEAVGNMDHLTLRNFANGAEMTFVNGALAGVQMTDIHLEDLL